MLHYVNKEIKLWYNICSPMYKTFLLIEFFIDFNNI